MLILAGGRRSRFKVLLSAYDEELKCRRCSAATRTQAAQRLPFLFHFLRRRGVSDPRQVSPADLAAYARSLARHKTPRGQVLSLWSQSTYLTAVRVFFAFLERRGFILSNPAAGKHLPMPKAWRRPRPVLSEAQARRLVSAPFPASPLGQRDRAILELLYGTGIRRTECVMVDITDLDLSQGMLLVRNGKGRKDRVVPIPARAARALEVYLRQARPEMVRAPGLTALFIDHRGRRRLATQGVALLVRKHGKAARIESAVSPHALRHACATHILQGGADVRHVQQLLGHRELGTTALYTRVAIKDLREVFAKAHPRERRMRQPR